MFHYTFLLPISITMHYVKRQRFLMVSEKISKSSLNKPSHNCRWKNVPQFNYSINVWFLSTVTNAKWVFILHKHVNRKDLKKLNNTFVTRPLCLVKSDTLDDAKARALFVYHTHILSWLHQLHIRLYPSSWVSLILELIAMITLRYFVTNCLPFL